MKNLALIGMTLSVSCISVTARDFYPTFELDYAKCASELKPIISGDGTLNNSVIFGSGKTCHAGRVVSKKRYKNITRARAKIDLSQLGQNYVNAAFYMVANPTTPSLQPKTPNYCDAGGNHDEWTCREIDFVETNGNKITQTTMHLGDGGQNAPQRYEYSFAATADNSCFNYNSMLSSPTPTNGLHSLVGEIDMSSPFIMVTEFTYGATPGMKTWYDQDLGTHFERLVYDTTDGRGAEGSKELDYKDLTKTMSEDGYWLVLSFWQGYSPAGPGSSPWWNGTCPWGSLCNTSGSYWGISEIIVTADSEE